MGCEEIAKLGHMHNRKGRSLPLIVTGFDCHDNFRKALSAAGAGVGVAAMSMFLVISTTWAVIALVMLIVAWRLIRTGKITPHRNIMILLTAGAWVFIFNYLFVQRYGAGLEPIPPEHIP